MIQNWNGKDGVVYTPRQYAAGAIPGDAYPLKAQYAPLPPPVPFSKMNIILTPCELFDDTPVFGPTWQNKLILLDKEEMATKLQETLSSIPPPPPPRVIHGFTMVATGSPYFFDQKCPHCGTKLTHTGTENSSWTHLYSCPGCESILVMDEGDKMGGGFDYWELFTKNKP